MKQLFFTILCLFGFVAAFSNNFEATNFNTSTTQPQKYVNVVLVMANDDGEEIVASIYTTLMTAEKVAGVLDVELIASEEVDDDLYVFTVKSVEEKDLTLKLFDEEGYEVNAHRQIKTTKGNTYKALNVESVSDGTYIFNLTDQNGNEINKKITINKQKY